MSGYTVYFDLETGGVESKHPTIQLAAVAVENGTFKEVGTFESKVRFDETMADPEALKINHYTPEAWKDAPTALAVSVKFSAFLRPFSSVQLTSKRTGMPYSVARLAGYNAVTFDGPRLKAMFAGSFFPCSYQILDVLQRALFYFYENTYEPPKDFKLTTLCEYFHIKTDGAHDALTDVRLTIALAQELRTEVF